VAVGIGDGKAYISALQLVDEHETCNISGLVTYILDFLLSVTSGTVGGMAIPMIRVFELGNLNSLFYCEITLYKKRCSGRHQGSQTSAVRP